MSRLKVCGDMVGLNYFDAGENHYWVWDWKQGEMLLVSITLPAAASTDIDMRSTSAMIQTTASSCADTPLLTRDESFS